MLLSKINIKNKKSLCTPVITYCSFNTSSSQILKCFKLYPLPNSIIFFKLFFSFCSWSENWSNYNAVNTYKAFSRFYLFIVNLLNSTFMYFSIVYIYFLYLFTLHLFNAHNSLALPFLYIIALEKNEDIISLATKLVWHLVLEYS